MKKTLQISGATITKDLFWKFRDSQFTGNFGDWLKEYRISADKKLKDFIVKMELRMKEAELKVKEKKSVAVLAEVEECVKKAEDFVLPTQGMELRKSLVQLRKAVEQAGRQNGYFGKPIVVSKADFDRHLQRALAPRLKDLPEVAEMLQQPTKIIRDYDEQKIKDGLILDLPPDIKAMAFNLGRSRNQATLCTDATLIRTATELFRHTENSALREAFERKEREDSERETKFNQWLLMKKQSEKSKKLEKEENELKRKLECEKIQKRSQRAVARWLKLREKNKYVSKVENGKVRKLPGAATCEHPNMWNKDIDLSSYYLQLDLQS